MIKYDLSVKIAEFISSANLKEISIGCSNSQVIKIEREDGVYFLKIATKGLLTKEYEKLMWLDGKLKVPKVVLYDVYNDIEYLVTSSCEGEMLCSEYYLENPREGIKVIAKAFQSLYNVDISDCPFDVSLEYRLNEVAKNVQNSLIKKENLKPEIIKKYKSPENLLRFLKENRFTSEKCFSHGDVSLPNVFANNNSFSGFIDVSECGVADKWFDLAICEKSIRRNYGEKYIKEFYEVLGIVPDREKINYYLLMMELYL